jgi:NAD(P)-dependent dehydrogenase (short-subunit alcohol dehydrogenase family)
MQLKDKKVLVTGASGGMGEATCKMLSDNSATVYGQFTKNAIQAKRVNGINADFSTRSAVEAFVATVKNQAVSLDALVFAHGIEEDLSESPLDTSYWEYMMQVNYYSVIDMCRLLLPIMNPGGVIIAISSIMGKNDIAVSLPSLCYASIKSALAKTMVSLAYEYAPKYRAVAISPGYTDTPIWNLLGEQMKKECAEVTPMKRFLSAEEVAHTVKYVLENDSITGQNIFIDGGLGIKLIE